MQNNNGVIKTKNFTLKPSSKEEIETFLETHLGGSLIEVISTEHYVCKCRVKTSDGEKVVSISLPAKYYHHHNK